MNETPLELFRKGCGMARDLELRITREDDTQVERHVFPHPFVLIGSHPANDFCIRDDAVSPRHLYLQVIRGALFCFDLGSRTGVRWGQKAEPYGWLATGRCLQIGPYRLWLSEAGAGPYADRPDPFDPQQERISQNPSSPRSTIEVQSGDGRTTRVDCTQHLTMVGRAPGCPIRLDHPSVSRFHCGLINTPNGIWFVDLLSREGTLVYGERRRWARLQEGEAFRVGNFTLRLRYEPAASPTAGREVLEPTSKQAGEAREVMAFGLIPSPADTGQSLAADYSGAVVSSPNALSRTYPNSVMVSFSMPDTGHADHALVPMRAEQSLLLPVIQQFNQMQQQMFDQFHQSMLMLVQMFGAMHREQMDLIRDELDELHHLTEELQTLQSELRKPAPQASPAAIARLETPEQIVEENGKPAEPPRPKVEVKVPTPPRTPRVPAAPPTHSGSPGEPSMPPAASGEDVHAWLSQRIEEIQRERQSRWQKVLKFVTGK